MHVGILGSGLMGGRLGEGVPSWRTDSSGSDSQMSDDRTWKHSAR